jgi:hypothetical protein
MRHLYKLLFYEAFFISKIINNINMFAQVAKQVVSLPSTSSVITPIIVPDKAITSINPK